MSANSDSKYVKAIRDIGRPSSPRMIRLKINSEASEGEQITAQNCASALNNLLAREKIERGDDGLYIVKTEELI